MSRVVNLRTVRKQKAREAKRADAGTAADRRDAAERARADRVAEGHKLPDPKAPPRAP